MQQEVTGEPWHRSSLFAVHRYDHQRLACLLFSLDLSGTVLLKGSREGLGRNEVPEENAGVRQRGSPRSR